MALQFAPFNVGPGTSAIVAGGGAGGPQIIQVFGILLQCSAAIAVELKAGSTPLTGPMTFATGGGFFLPNNGIGPWFQDITGGADLNLTVAGIVGQAAGYIMYEQF